MRKITRFAANAVFVVTTELMAQYDWMAQSEHAWWVVSTLFVVTGLIKARKIDENFNETVTDFGNDLFAAAAFLVIEVLHDGPGVWVWNEIGGLALVALMYAALAVILWVSRTLPDGGALFVSVFVIGALGLALLGCPKAAAMLFAATIALAIGLARYWDQFQNYSASLPSADTAD